MQTGTAIPIVLAFIFRRFYNSSTNFSLTLFESPTLDSILAHLLIVFKEAANQNALSCHASENATKILP